MSRKYFTVISGLLAGLLTVGPAALVAGPAAVGYSIYVDSVDGGPGSDVPVRFNLRNEAPLASVTVPIAYDPAAVFLKSVSFADSRAQHIGNKIVTPANLLEADGHFMVAIFQWLEDPIPAGDGLIFTALFTIDPEAAIETVAVLDTLFYPPGGRLEVVRADSPVGIEPEFEAGRIAVGENNRSPVFATLADQYVLEGAALDLEIAASDPDNDDLTLAVTTKPTGASFVDNGDGLAQFAWTPDYVGPNSADGSPITVSFWVSDGDLSAQMELLIHVLNSNRKPVITAPEAVSVGAGATLQFSLSAVDPDFEPISWSWSGIPDDASFDAGNPGQLTWQSSVTDSGSFVMEFVATDPQGLADTALVLTSVQPVALYTLGIDSVEAFPNEDIEFGIVLDNRLPVSSFNLLVNHDPTALAYISMSNAGTRSEPFEYFTVQTNDNGVPGNVRIIGIADTGGGTAGLAPGDGPIAIGCLHTTGDLAFAGLSVPLTFQFMDTPVNDDNTLADSAGTKIEQGDITYVTGAVSIHDVGQIRIGDINLNGLAAEIGDVIYFTNFFINPILYRFNALQYANSDVNQDYIAATLSDLVALINLVVGGSSFGKTGGEQDLVATLAADVIGDRTYFCYDAALDVGAAYVVFETDRTIAPEVLNNLADNMTLDFRQDGREVRVLLYSLDGETMPAGPTELFVVTGLDDFEITHLELSSADGRRLEVSLAGTNAGLPVGFILSQNYPNPFNPETSIEFALPHDSQIELTVFNVLGQRVTVLASGKFPAGTHRIGWSGTDADGRPVASGVYLYRLVAGSGTLTRKMMLLR